VCQCGRPWTGGGGVGHQPDVHKDFFAFWEFVLESDTPLHRLPDCNILRTFLCAYGPEEGGVSSKRKMLDRGGVSKKSFFARTSLMNDILLT